MAFRGITRAGGRGPSSAEPRLRRRVRVPRWLSSAASVIAIVAITTAIAHSQATPPPTSASIPCPEEGQPLLQVPGLRRADDGPLKGILKGTIVLTDEQQRLELSTKGGGAKRCAPQWVRVFRGVNATPEAKPAPPVNPNYPDSVPGPTLRARVGDLVQLTFVNEVNSGHYDPNIDREACIRVISGKNELYPGTHKDSYPNCLHASSTANIHFHGTHTNPNSTGDNVFLQVRPLPRDNRGNLLVSRDAITKPLEQFFTDCRERLRKDPLMPFPTRWTDLPAAWTGLSPTPPPKDSQKFLLNAYDNGTSPYNPPAKAKEQKLWPPNEAQLKDGWPQYYVGAFPHCFALPEYTANNVPRPPTPSPIMGQAPGTHWYHAHKHGSTAINVAEGMTGVFIIEGEYDDAIKDAYGEFGLKTGKWNIRSQPVMVLNQLSTAPNLLGGTSNTDFSVNGRIRPRVQMQPGEVQLWRIANTSGRSAAYFNPPEGLEWRQLAQDGVQFSSDNYLNPNNLNQPFFLASGNRVDLLVKAPLKPATAKVMIQNVMGRASVQPGTGTGTLLFTVEIAGDQVKGPDGRPAEMQFLTRSQAPRLPPFLRDITDEEWQVWNKTETLVFHSKKANEPKQHTINTVQFGAESAKVKVPLGAVGQWTLKNSTVTPNGPFQAIDHPFHIHINPFQITEVFDPNEKVAVNGSLVARYVNDPNVIKPGSKQCYLNPKDDKTWRPCQPDPKTNLVWWDVFAIPAGRVMDGVTIPGYFTMRSRFVDYFGYYVLHCHILAHEDRGMMFTVEVTTDGAGRSPAPVHH